LVAASPLVVRVSAQEENPRVLMKTTMGDITIELYAKEAPISTKNFLDYAESDFYGGTIFHRVIDGFMIQGGGFTKDMQKKSTKAPIKNEAGNGLKNEKYTLAMARTSDPNSATSQFFINTTDNAFLNREQAQDGVGYAVFGKVIEGLEVVDKMGKVQTTRVGPYSDVPTKPIIITEAKQLKSK
jgi:cyclophilin family peptidyl-prolyl cis-trans isomerase